MSGTNEQRTYSSPETLERPDIRYRYIVKIRAVEAFANLMAREGIPIAGRSLTVSFESPRRLNMKAYKDGGLVWSYSVIEVRIDEQIIDEG